MTMILDAGALLALERNDRAMWGRLKRARAIGEIPITSAGVVGQVWRGGSGRQAPLARALAGIEVTPLDDRIARRAGVLLGRTRTSDVIDAAVALLASEDDVVLTSDPGDLRLLVDATGIEADVVPI